jgi:hypothetical protein
MDSSDALSPLYSLEEARVTPIAELCPDLPDPRTKAVRGVVTITWPYNSVNGTFAFNLAEPDFRLRRNKGQVRIDFTGSAAKAAGGCGLTSNDEVLLSLEGAVWEAVGASRRESLPGADLGWRLIFSEKLSLQILQAETRNTIVVAVDEQTPKDLETARNSTSIQPLTATKPLSPPAPFSPVRITSPVREERARKLDDGEFASPAFIKRARVSYGSLFEGNLDIFEDDGGIRGMGRKRTRFGRDSSAWRYASQSPSPEPAAALIDIDDYRVVSPARADTADEGCQTMELDQSSPRPVKTPLDTRTDVMSPDFIPVDEAPADTPVESTKEGSADTRPLGDLPSASTVQNDVALTYNEVPHLEVDDTPHLSHQQLGYTVQSFASGSWNADINSSALEPQQQQQFTNLHAEEPLSASEFGNKTSVTQPRPFGDPGGLGKPHVAAGENAEPIDNDTVYSAASNPPTVSYSPPDVTDGTHSHPIHDEALTDYPASYLDDDYTTQHSQMMGEQTSEYPAIVELGPSSWTTINHTSQVTAVPAMDPPRSRDGDTPEQALVIGESDSDDECAPEPMAVEDTIDSGRAYALEMYEDAEAEDEVDAQYSDDDEPEYDADEMGGDYDTRNYEQPDDDEDDSHDEDLRPHPLEPEFNDGESWDEEDQDELLEEEDEADHETDDESVEPVPQSVVRSNPTVIDLISSSEDEGEEEEVEEGEGHDIVTNTQRPGAPTISMASSSRQESTAEGDLTQQRLSDEDAEMASQVALSETDISSEMDRESNEYISSHEEAEEEEEEVYRINDDNEVEDYEQKDVPMSEASRNEVEQQAKQETEHERKPESDGVAALDDTQDHRDDSLSCQIESPDQIRESISLESRMEVLEEEGSANMPLSAAEGLEMLSRVLDNESNANNISMLSETVLEDVILETISVEQSRVKLSEEHDVHMQDSSNHKQNTISAETLEELSAQSDEVDQVDLVAPPNLYTEHQSPVFNESERTADVPTLSPLTQSFQAGARGDAAGSILEETASNFKAQDPNAQLPTPQQTQVTDIVLDDTNSTNAVITESFGLNTGMEHLGFESRKASVSEEPADEVLQREISMIMGEDDVEHQDNVISFMQDEAEGALVEPSSPASSAHSFQTQIDEGEPISPDSFQARVDDDRPPRNVSSGHDESTSIISTSLTSHRDIDEELQASILENSQVEGKPLNRPVQTVEHDETVRANEQDEAFQVKEQDETIGGHAIAATDAEASNGVHARAGQTQHAEVILSPVHEQLVVEIPTIREHKHDVMIQSNRNEDTLAEATGGVDLGSERTQGAETASSPLHEQLVVEIPSSTFHEGTPEEQAAEISAQLMQNFIENESSPTESSDIQTGDDPGLLLARVANASKRTTKSRGSSADLHRPQARALDAHRSPTPEAEDSSVQLARASFTRQPPKQDEDSYSMTAAKLQLVRHLRDELPDCTSLKVLRQHLTKSLDVIAVTIMQPPDPRRAKGGPREYKMAFTVTDHSIGPYAVAEVLIHRPHKDTLPVVKYGDVVLLRNFTVVSLPNKGFGLKTNDGSSWAVFDREDEPAQINGPPVEYGEKETTYVSYLREWFGLLGDSAKAKLVRANEKIMNAGKTKLG